MGTPLHIHSPSNAVSRTLLSLAKDARQHTVTGKAMIEGDRLLWDWVDRFGWGSVSQVFVGKAGWTNDEANHLAVALRDRATPKCWILSDRLFRQVSGLEQGSGPIAIVSIPKPAGPPDSLSDAVFLDGVQDPGNVGSVLRTCVAMQVKQVIAGSGTASCWSGKVLRAAMGAHLHLDIYEKFSEDALEALWPAPWRIAHPHGGRSICDADLLQPGLWLFGNEGRGVRPAFLQSPKAEWLSVPIASNMESLNVGVAAAICLYEQQRQRQWADCHPSSLMGLKTGG